MKTGKIQIMKSVTPLVEWAMALFSIFYCVQRGFGSLPLTWTFNVSADLICMFINLFFIMGILFGSDSAGTKYSRFLRICHFNFLSLFLDLLSWMADGFAGRGIILAINTGLYISNLCLTAVYSHFIIEMIVKDSKKHKRYLQITYILLAITVVTRLLNVKYGYFFTVSEEGIYSRGAYQFLSYIYTVVIEILTLVILIRGDASREQQRAVFAFTIIPFVAAVVSIFIYGLSLMYACVLVSIVMIYSAFFVELEEGRNKIIRTFEKFISNDIVQKIVDTPSGKLVPGHRYTATALVSDIRGFTSFSEDMSPQDLVSMLNHYFGVVTEVISHYGGIVTEFLGDGILCIFGAPKETTDHGEAAVAAALSVQSKIPEINRWNREQGYPELSVGIGIHTGTMVLGSLGDETRAKYTAVGQTIDKAFSIESCSVGGQVLASASTLRAVNADLSAEFLVDYMPDPDSFSKLKIYEITHIGGKWNIGNKRDVSEPVPLEKPVEAQLRVLMGKHADTNFLSCTVEALSKDAVLLRSDCKIEPLDNLLLRIPGVGTVNAKAEKTTDGTVTAVFTSVIKADRVSK